MLARFTSSASLKVSAVFLAALLASFAVSAANYQLAPYKISYLLERGDITIGIGDYELKTDGVNYLYSSEARAKGFLAKIIMGDKVITEQSAGTLIDNNPRPNSFRYNQGEGEKRNQEVDFDWVNNTATVTYKFKANDVALSGEVHDKLSMQLSAMRTVANGTSTGELNYQVAERGGLGEYRFEVVGKQPLTIGSTRYDTVVLKRLASDRQATFWVAPELGYAIIKAEQKKRDKPVVRLTMRSIEGKPLIAR